jgi:activating signal cointegrator 1
VKALSLTQPWASLVAEGFKLVETRSWSTPYRGPLAIHAAAGFPVDARLYASLPQFKGPLVEAGYRVDHRQSSRSAALLDHTLPLGAVIATARLVRCVRTEEIARHINPQERAFGDYDPGRFAWVLAEVVKLPEPVPAKGALGLWEWTLPEGVLL